MGARDPPKSLDPQSSFRRFKVNRGNTFQFLAHKFLSSTDEIGIQWNTNQTHFTVLLLRPFIHENDKIVQIGFNRGFLGDLL